MKKLLVVSSLMLSLNQNAIGLVIDDSSCDNIMIAGCLLASTTFLPSLFIADSEVGLSKSETSDRLLAEANHDVEPVISELLAQKLNISVLEIFEKTKELESNGVLSAENLIKSFKH